MRHSLLSVSNRIGHTGHYSRHNRPHQATFSLKFIDSTVFCPSIMSRSRTDSHESLWRLIPNRTRRAFEMNCFLKSSPFISNCPHCTVPPSQILLHFFFFFFFPAVPHFSPSLILSLLVPCHSPLCHSLFCYLCL